MPGVQKPHCTAPWETKASRSFSPIGVDATASTVVSTRPSQSTANIRQALTETPSTKIVHAPHSPSPQPYLVPINPSPSRIIARALIVTGTAIRFGAPLIMKRISCCSDIVQHPFGQVVNELPPVPLGSTNVGDRPHFVVRDLGDGADRVDGERAALERRFGFGRPDRRGRDRAEGDPNPGQHPALQNPADADRDRRNVERGPRTE